MDPVQIARMVRSAAFMSVVWSAVAVAHAALPVRFDGPVAWLALSLSVVIVASTYIAEMAAWRR